jgi:hypothetical protein
LSAPKSRKHISNTVSIPEQRSMAGHSMTTTTKSAKVRSISSCNVINSFSVSPVCQFVGQHAFIEKPEFCQTLRVETLRLLCDRFSTSGALQVRECHVCRARSSLCTEGSSHCGNRVREAYTQNTAYTRSHGLSWCQGTLYLVACKLYIEG